MYNPWSVINYVYDIVHKNTEYPKPYWSNTSSNSIVRELIENADGITRNELEELVDGNTIEKPVHEDITYEDVHKSQDNLWNFLFFTGYLKAVGKKFKSDTIYLILKIPNREIRSIYRDKVTEWFDNKIKVNDFQELVTALEDGDCNKISDIITGQLMETISFYDYKEDYYHGFLAGLLKHNKKYFVKSNGESGLGRYDLVLKTQRIRKGKAIIIELKVAGNINGMEKGCTEALGQIEKMHYDSSLLNEGYTDITKYGICFYKKNVLYSLPKNSRLPKVFRLCKHDPRRFHSLSDTFPAKQHYLSDLPLQIKSLAVVRQTESLCIQLIGFEPEVFTGLVDVFTCLKID